MIDEHGQYDGRLDEHVESSARQPHRRLRKVLLKGSSAAALCGLIRADHLRRTRLRASYALDDIGLLAELALIGEFWMIREVLVKVRVHPGNARKVHATSRSHAVWLDPANEKKFLLHPRFRLLLECFRSILHVPMHPAGKLLCGAAGAVAYCERPFRDIAGRWKNRFRQFMPLQEGEEVGPLDSDLDPVVRVADAASRLYSGERSGELTALPPVRPLHKV
jgi:hypothetical protein